MTKFNLFSRFGYIWYVCPVTGNEKKTAFRSNLAAKPLKQARELEKVQSFKEYGMDLKLATAVMGFILTGSEPKTFIES